MAFEVLVGTSSTISNQKDFPPRRKMVLHDDGFV
jgi:hypothetical protein